MSAVPAEVERDGGLDPDKSWVSRKSLGRSWALRNGWRNGLGEFDGSGLAKTSLFLWWNDPMLMVLAAVGATVGGWRAVRTFGTWERHRRGRLAIALAYAVPQVVVMFLWSGTRGRYLLPVYPFLACLAASGAFAGIDRLSSLLRGASARVALVVVCCLILLSPSTVASSKLVLLRHRPDTVQQAAAWIADEIGPRNGKILVTPGLNIPLFHEQRALESHLRFQPVLKSRWIPYQALLPSGGRGGQEYELHLLYEGPGRQNVLKIPKKALGFVRRSDALYVVFEVTNLTMKFPGLAQIRRALAQEATLVAEFLPRGPEHRVTRAISDTQGAPNMFRRVLLMDPLGPTIEIYRLVGCNRSSCE